MMIGHLVGNVGSYIPGKPRPRRGTPNTGRPGESWGTPEQWKALQNPPVAAGTTPGPSNGTPGPPAAPVMPWDTQYENTAASVGRDQSTDNAGFTGDENSLGLNYGVNFTRGSDGTLASTSIDPNVDVTNPYSRAALLKKSYERTQASNTTGLAAQGQLYSGALQNAQNYAGGQFLQGQNTLLSDFGAGWRGISSNRLAAGRSRQDRLDNAGWQKITADIANRATSPEYDASAIKPDESGKSYLDRLPYTIAIIGGKRVLIDKITNRPWKG